ncbi:MAG: TetR/AcrR family transcriptional regulator [Pseudonocardia sp.]|uniref:TetR/AcrR family transcriptional regulator n=1 Tax=unclassified Pseudonocardia TaxID=2619320 RepID=UPI00086C10F4|nr:MULTISPECIES: TetR/AcrR family transcriptional regulator [unclassified Pseudonocardia]MBN9109298.1 TetR/AcrR family transcriptional regulator [Pseudonocardia sp.]ODU23165.1 MAG: TetR family transcriptional regulator [Pseudonocardia sp. SCN 72-51]ODV08016.1 MAG: TetR family transcriptional regulator [Pseudonocardia sp. SCN 73-27]
MASRTADTTRSDADRGPQTRPGGRSARVRTAVHRAVVELLAEGPAEQLTMPLIAARAGVHPTTVYRRWASLGDLLAAVAESRFTGDLVVPDTGSLRGDLRRWATDVATDLTDPETLAIIRAALGASTEGGCACIGERRTQLGSMLDRERDRGGVVPTVDRAADVLMGPIYFRALFTEQPGDADWARDLADALVDHCTGTAAPSPA